MTLTFDLSQQSIGFILSESRLVMIKMSAKFDEDVHNIFVIIAFTGSRHTINFAVLWNLTENAIFRQIFGTFLFIS